MKKYKTYRKWMLQAVKNELLPRLREQDFERVFLKGEEKKAIGAILPIREIPKVQGKCY